MTEPRPSRPRSIREEIGQTKPFTHRSQEAYLSLLRTADDAKRRVTSVLEPAGITLQQYNLLRILRGARPDGLPTLTVAERMVEKTPGVTRLVDRMEASGWVTRHRRPEDRRKVWCKITEAGLRLLEPLEEPVNAVGEYIFGALDDDEAARLIDYLDRVRAVEDG